MKCSTEEQWRLSFTSIYIPPKNHSGGAELERLKSVFFTGFQCRSATGAGGTKFRKGFLKPNGALDANPSLFFSVWHISRQEKVG